jgi:hypothetical protein
MFSAAIVPRQPANSDIHWWPETHVFLGFVKDDQASCSLVQDPMKDTVEDHLAKPDRENSANNTLLRYPEDGQKKNILCLDILDGLFDRLGNVANFDTVIRFDDAHEVLLE